MKKLEYKVSFTTPAFLGNADQNGQWRTPPFKALLRQWWRVAYASNQRFAISLADMRRIEGILFGNAWLSHEENGHSVADHCRSLVRLRLSSWDLGRQKTWQSLEAVRHPEVKFPVDSGLYLGYGPVTIPRGARQPTLKGNAAIQAGESSLLSLAVPDESALLVLKAIRLMNCFGTLGGRSRNGWGSFTLIPADEHTPAVDVALDPGMVRPWKESLELDWPHSIGRDDSGTLIWKTEPFADSDWKKTMRRLAEIKIGLRTQFTFATGNNAPVPEKRHWMGYPVTRHSVRGWGNARLPNSLRFKVRPDPDGRLRGVIFHVPCLPPTQFNPDRRAIEGVWQRVHAYLDDPAQKLSRIPA